MAAAIFTILFFVFNVLPDITKEKKQNEERIETIKRHVLKNMESDKGSIKASEHTLIMEESSRSKGNNIFG